MRLPPQTQPPLWGARLACLNFFRSFFIGLNIAGVKAGYTRTTSLELTDMYSKSPCKDCTERTAECHAICERFLIWDQAHRQKRDEEYRRRGVDFEYGIQAAKRQLERMKHKFKP